MDHSSDSAGLAEIDGVALGDRNIRTFYTILGTPLLNGNSCKILLKRKA
jgi:hypothetical protein